MTPQDRIKRVRFFLDSIESKIGASEPGPIEVALCDYDRMMRDISAIAVELGERKATVRR